MTGESEADPGWRRLIRFSKILFGPLAIAFLAYAVWSDWAFLSATVRNAHAPYLLLAALAWVPLHALAPVLAVALFKPAGIDIDYRKAFLIHANRIPARYIPGGIWHTVGRALDYHELGASPRLLATYVTVEHVLAACVALLPGGLVVFNVRGWDTWGTTALFAACASAIGLLVFFWIINRIALPRPPIRFNTYAGLILLYMVFWTGAAIAFVLFLSAFEGVAEGVSAVHLGGTYLFAWGIGFLAVFAPQGIGVFEAVAGHLLSSGLSLGALAALVAGFRLVVLIADLGVWVGSRFLRQPSPTALSP